MKIYKLLFLTLLFLVCNSSEGQNYFSQSKAGNQNAFTRVDAPEVYQNRAVLGKIATTNFIIEYTGQVPTEAPTAFEKAIDIWSHSITIGRPIKIRVNFDYQLGVTWLAQSGPSDWRNNFSNAPFPNTQYPICMAKNFDGNIAYDTADFFITFNNAFNWNYQINGIPVEDKYDFVTVALHEIGHGLGFCGSFKIENNIVYSGFTNLPLNYTGVYPTIFDRFFVSGTTRLIEVTNSTTLGNLLKSNNVYFDGSNAKQANNNQNVKMYAPSQWEPGSSIYHLDEATFNSNPSIPNSLHGGPNSLMTPTLDKAEVIHNPGYIFLKMLEDLGYTVDRFVVFNNLTSLSQMVIGQNFTVNWYDNNGGFLNIELHKVTPIGSILIGTINGSSPIYSSAGMSNNNYQWSVSNNLENGYYFLKAVQPGSSFGIGLSQTFIISNIPGPPFFNPPGGQYSSSQNVRLYSNTLVDEIRYVIGNEEPDENSTLFNPSQPIVIETSKKIRAKSFLLMPNNQKVGSNTTEATYHISSNSFTCELSASNYNYGSYFHTTGYNSCGYEPNFLKVGRTTSSIFRGYAVWTGFRDIIPPNAVIQSVEFFISFSPTSVNTNIEFRRYNPPLGSDEHDKWEHIGDGAAVVTLQSDINKFNCESFIADIQNIVNNTTTIDRFGVGIKNLDENNPNNCIWSQSGITIKIYYRGNVEITQLDKNDSPYGEIGLWNGTSWENKVAPSSLFLNNQNNIRLKSEQAFKTGTNEKYNRWLNKVDICNHQSFPININSVNEFTAKFEQAYLTPKIQNCFVEFPGFNAQTDKIWFQDPWLVDFNEAPYGLRNRGILEAEWYEKNSPIDFSQPEFSNYKGVFLNQGITPQGQWQPPYYSVQAISPQDISLSQTGKTHRFYFQNWEYDQSKIDLQYLNALQTGIVFKDAPAILNANMKGTQLTNQSSAFSNNSQRKLIRSKSNDLHMVYSSLDKVWYEYSTNNGQTWELSYNSPGFSNTLTKSGSIDYKPKFGTQTIVNNIGIVVQEKTGYLSSIKFYGVGEDFFYFPDENPVVIEDTYFPYESYDLTPSFAWSHNGDILVIWKSEMDLRFWLGYIGPHGVECYETGNIQGVEGEPFNPTLYAGPQNTFHVAWQENSTRIVYRQFVCSGFSLTPITPREVVSYGSGFTWNYQPTITENNNEPRIGWVGKRLKVYEDEKDRLDKGTFTEEGVYEYRAILRRKINETWSNFHNYEDNISQVSINKSGTDDFIFGWARNDLRRSKYVRNGSLNAINSINSFGNNLQITNSPSYSFMKAVFLQTSSIPYYFKTSHPLDGTSYPDDELEKETSLGEMSVARTGILTKDEAEFYFLLGDILLNNETIDFKTIEDTMIVDNLSLLNSVFESVPFILNNQSILQYSVSYGIIDSVKTEAVLNSGDFVSFKVELVDAMSNELIGVFDDITYEPSNLYQYNNIAYNIESEGIGERMVKLRLITSNNINAIPSLADVFSQEDVLAKANLKTIRFTGSLTVTDYALSQNYPNPFNPVTTINYQIPKDGFVSLKVYDILGKEIATLVNSDKAQGKYTVEFDGSRFASGMYIYKLQSGDFVETRKMMMLK